MFDSYFGNFISYNNIVQNKT